jgi:L-lactate dehydrogenase complex protein LldE
LFPAVPRATVTVLGRLGHEVVFPAGRTCCGQMHVITGYQFAALPVVRHHVKVFEDCEVVVAPSGSCVGSVRHQHARVARRAGDEPLARRAEAVAGQNLRAVGAAGRRPGRGGRRGVVPAPGDLPPDVPLAADAAGGRQAAAPAAERAGLELVELPQAESCCGFCGTFALKNADTSTAMLADKMRHVVGTGAEVCTAGDSSCLMHIGGGLSRMRTGVRTLHLAEILAATDDPVAGMTGETVPAGIVR